MNRRPLRSIARWLAAALLIAQLAVAAYACPSFNFAAAGDPQTEAALVAAGCDEPMGQADAAHPHLCAEHCKTGQQSDHAASLVLPLPASTLLYPQRAPPLQPISRRPVADPLSDLVAATPPHAILHCVRRT